MQELFKEKHYTDLDGGILEGFGRLLKYDLKLYVYPTKDDKTGQLVTADTLKVRIIEQSICQAALNDRSGLPHNRQAEDSELGTATSVD